MKYENLKSVKDICEQIKEQIELKDKILLETFHITLSCRPWGGFLSIFPGSGLQFSELATTLKTEMLVNIDAKLTELYAELDKL